MIEEIFDEGLTLIKGLPGSGKTSLAAWAASRYKNAAWFTFYENRTRLLKFLSSMGLEPPRHIFDMFSIPNRSKELVEVIVKQIKETSPDFVVIDGLNVLMQEGERELVHQLLYHLLSSLVPVVLIREGVEITATDYIADNVIMLDYKVSERGISRYLTILKSRGRAIDRAVFGFILTRGGPKLISPPGSAKRISDERLTTGAPELDKELNGGIIAGSYVAVVGPPDGLASKLMVLTASVLAGQGKRVLYHHHKVMPAFVKFAESLGVRTEHPNLIWYYHPIDEHKDLAWWYRSAEMVNEANIDVHFADQYEQVVAVAGIDTIVDAAQIYQGTLRREVTTVLVVNSYEAWRRISAMIGSVPDYVFMLSHGALKAYTPERTEPLKFRYHLRGRRVVFEKLSG